MNPQKKYSSSQPDLGYNDVILQLLDHISRRDGHLLWLQEKNKTQTDSLRAEESKTWLLSAQLAAVENTLQQKEIILQQKEMESMAAHSELMAIHASRTWRFVLLIRRFREWAFPIGSLRSKFASGIWRVLISIIRILLRIRDYLKNIVLNFKKAIHHIRYYGVGSLFKRVWKWLFPASSEKIVGLSMQGNVTEMSAEQKRDRSLLSTPLMVYSIPRTAKRVNLYLDRLDNENIAESNLVSVVTFAVMLVEKWQCDLRVITRLDVAKKSYFSSILNDVNISAPNVEFSFIQAGNSKMSLQVGSDEYFVVTSWQTARSVHENINADRIIYLVQQDERVYCTSEQDTVSCNEILTEKEMQFTFKTKTLYDRFVSEGFDHIRDQAGWFEVPTVPIGWRQALEQSVNQIKK
ncbi:MAG: hypothetical protein IPN96_22550 [Anaerolineales bacterium]|nr:hypothetical protein [Anaerolineales bacterium]